LYIVGDYFSQNTFSNHEGIGVTTSSAVYMLFDDID